MKISTRPFSPRRFGSGRRHINAGKATACGLFVGGHYSGLAVMTHAPGILQATDERGRSYAARPYFPPVAKH